MSGSTDRAAADRWRQFGVARVLPTGQNPMTGPPPSLLGVAASVKGGHATAALVVGQLCSSKRLANTLAAAIKEYGALRRTPYAARYLADETCRRRIARQLNKGENLHALRRSLAYAGEGAVRRRHHEQQNKQMWCLTLATNAIVCWSTEYHCLAVGALRVGGRLVDD
jgi:TnpA family transposase